MSSHLLNCCWFVSTLHCDGGQGSWGCPMETYTDIFIQHMYTRRELTRGIPQGVHLRVANKSSFKRTKRKTIPNSQTIPSTYCFQIAREINTCVEICRYNNRKSEKSQDTTHFISCTLNSVCLTLTELYCVHVHRSNSLPSKAKHCSLQTNWPTDYRLTLLLGLISRQIS